MSDRKEKSEPRGADNGVSEGAKAPSQRCNLGSGTSRSLFEIERIGTMSDRKDKEWEKIINKFPYFEQIKRPFATTVIGPPGTGKTSFATSFLSKTAPAWDNIVIWTGSKDSNELFTPFAGPKVRIRTDTPVLTSRLQSLANDASSVQFIKPNKTTIESALSAYSRSNTEIAAHPAARLFTRGVRGAQPLFEEIQLRPIVQVFNTFNKAKLSEYLKKIETQQMERISKGEQPLYILFIFDDILVFPKIMQKNTIGPLEAIFSAYRHWNVSIMVLSQSYRSFSPALRNTMMSHLILLGLPHSQIRQFCEEHANEYWDENELYELYTKIRKEGFGNFLVINYKTDLTKRFQHNFSPIIKSGTGVAVTP